MKKVPRDLLEFIKTGNKFIIAGHKEPDGDCIGSQLALDSVLRRAGKKTILLSAGSFDRTEIKKYSKLFKSKIDENLKKDARVIITDCTKIERTGDIAPFIEGLPAALIDHHKRENETKSHDLGPTYIDEKASSTTLLILYLIKALGMELTKEEAEYILFGLCTDTGFFRHLSAESSEAFEAAALLVKAGASPKKVHAAMYGGKSLGTRLLIAHVLQSIEPHFNGRLIIATEEYEETQKHGKEGRDSDILYQLLQSIDGVEAIAVIRQEKPDNCTIGLRSLDKIDVDLIARNLGGGGHKNAAGGYVPGTILDVKKKVLKFFKLYM